MRVIADTNLTYYLGDGRLTLANICQPGETLYICPVVILELIAGMDATSRASKTEACKAIQTSGAMFLEDPETWVRGIMRLPPLEEGFEWHKLIQAAAQSYGYDPLQRRLIFLHPDRNGTRQMTAYLDIAVLDRWNEMHEKQWLDTLCKPLKTYIPGMAEWFKTKDGQRPRLSIPKKDKVPATADIENPQVLEVIVRELLRRMVPDTVQRTEIDISSLTSGPLACYAMVMRQYIKELVLERSVPQPNDRWDTEFFLYLNDSNSMFATAESRWVNIAKRAGYAERVRQIKL